MRFRVNVYPWVGQVSRLSVYALDHLGNRIGRAELNRAQGEHRSLAFEALREGGVHQFSTEVGVVPKPT